MNKKGNSQLNAGQLLLLFQLKKKKKIPPDSKEFSFVKKKISED